MFLSCTLTLKKMEENSFNFPPVYKQASSDAQRPACLLELTRLSQQCGGGSDKKQNVFCCQVRFGSALCIAKAAVPEKG